MHNAHSIMEIYAPIIIYQKLHVIYKIILNSKIFAIIFAQQVPHCNIRIIIIEAWYTYKNKQTLDR